MMDFKNSETAKNLMRAFAGESLACLVPGSTYPIGCGKHGGLGLH